MPCYDELTLSIAADGELPDDESRRLQTHLADCPRCQLLFLDLATEAASLRTALGEAAQLLPSERGPVRVQTELPQLSWPFWLGGVAAACAGTVLTLNGLAPSALPASVAWLHPLRPDLALSLLSSFAFDWINNGVPTMSPNLLLIIGIILLASVFGRRSMKPATLACALILALPSPAHATVLRCADTGFQTIVIGANEIIDDTVVAAADTVVVDGVIKGDLITLAREVRVKGKVTGSVAGLAKHLEIDGQVEGDVYTAQEGLILRGQVGRNLHAAAKNLVIDSSAVVGHDLRGAAEDARIAGSIGRGLNLYAKSAELAGNVGGPAVVQSERVTVRESSRVKGDFTITVPKKANANIASNAVAQGTTQVREAPGPWQEVSPLRQPQFYVWQILWLVAALVSGALIHWLAPAALAKRETSPVATLKSMGLGFIILIVTPIAAILVGLTVVGLPTGAFVFASWLAALYVSGIFASAWLGRLVLKRPGSDLQTLLLTLLVGQVLLRVIKMVPVLGGLVGFCALILGLGLASAAFLAGFRRLRSTLPPGLPLDFQAESARLPSHS